MKTFIAAVIIILILSSAICYIIKSVKSGKKCIGCPASGSCPKSGMCNCKK